LGQTLTTSFRTGPDDEREEILESMIVTIEGGVIISDRAWDSGLLFVRGTSGPFSDPFCGQGYYVA
jgi:hypothetical protein